MTRRRPYAMKVLLAAAREVHITVPGSERTGQLDPRGVTIPLPAVASVRVQFTVNSP